MWSSMSVRSTSVVGAARGTLPKTYKDLMRFHPAVIAPRVEADDVKQRLDVMAISDKLGHLEEIT